jgi:DNA transformation protein
LAIRNGLLVEAPDSQTNLRCSRSAGSVYDGAMRQEAGEERLEAMVNLGRTAADLLRSVGIETASDLRRLGSLEAAFRIRAAQGDDAVCRSRLSALEGAVRGVRWHSIPKPERDRLWHDYRTRVSKPSSD